MYTTQVCKHPLTRCVQKESQANFDLVPVVLICPLVKLPQIVNAPLRSVISIFSLFFLKVTVHLQYEKQFAMTSDQVAA